MGTSPTAGTGTAGGVGESSRPRPVPGVSLFAGVSCFGLSGLGGFAGLSGLPRGFDGGGVVVGVGCGAVGVGVAVGVRGGCGVGSAAGSGLEAAGGDGFVEDALWTTIDALS